MTQSKNTDHGVVEEQKTVEKSTVSHSIPVDILLQTAFDGIVAIDTEQRIITFNKGAELIFGYQEKDLIGKKIDVLIPERFLAHHHEHVEAFLQSGDFVRPMDGSLRTIFGRHKEGHDVPLEAILCKSVSVDSQTTTLSVFIRDISSRQRAEIALQQQEAYFRALVEDSNDAIMLFNADGSRQYISPSAEKVLGLELEILKRDLEMTYLHHDDAHIMKEAVESVIADPSRTITVIYRVKQKNGEWRWIEGLLKNLCHDPRVRAIVVNNRDITEHRRIEQALRDNQRHFRQLLAAIPVGVFETDQDGSCTFINEKWCEMTGLKPNEALGDGWIQGIYPEDQPRLLDEWKAAREQNRPAHIEYRLVNRDGKTTWVLGYAIAVYDDNGVVTGYTGSVTDISERIDAEEALRESESRFRQLFNTSPTPIGLTRLSDGCIQNVNEALTELFGWSREEFIGKTSLELGMWANEADRQMMTDKIRAGETVRNMNLKVRVRSGEIRDTLTSVDTIQLDGTPCLLVASTDVTEQLKAVSLIKWQNRLLNTLSAVNEMLLQESDPQQLFEKACRVIIEKAGFLMAWIGIADLEQGTVTQVAEAGVAHDYLSKVNIRCDDSEWGRGPTGTSIRENRTVVIVDTDTDPRYAAWRETARKYGFRSSAAVPLRHNDRVFGSLNIYSQNVNDFGPDELPLLERMSADLGLVYERLEMQKALRDSENRLASFFSEAPVGLVLYDEEQHFLQVNSMLASSVNLSPEDLTGKSPSDVLPPPMAKLIEDSVKNVFKRGVAKINEEIAGPVPAESTNVRHWMHTHFPIRDTEGHVYAVGGFVVETTVLKQAEEALKQLNQELETRVKARTEALAAANEELESFAYSVSHDLRTPLRSIDGFSRLLLEDYKDSIDDEGRDHFSRIIKAVNHMGAVIDALLALSRLSRKELTPQNVSSEKLTVIVRDIIHELAIENDTQAINWQIESLSPCYADITLLRQLWYNLLHNAAKYTSHVEHPQVRVGTLDYAGKKTYYVSDNGIGFDMKYADKIFGVFQRLHAQDEFEGTGIGLATVHRIVGMLGGHIWAESELNKGATFYFTLP